MVDKVQISDLENAAHLPKPRCIKGMLAGNDNWRSPEGHFKGELNKPSDMYSFGLTVGIWIRWAFAMLIHIVYLFRSWTRHSRLRRRLQVARIKRRISCFHPLAAPDIILWG